MRRSRGSQRDVVYLGWPIAPSYMSPNAGEGDGGWVQLCTWRPNKLWRPMLRRNSTICKNGKVPRMQEPHPTNSTMSAKQWVLLLCRQHASASPTLLQTLAKIFAAKKRFFCQLTFLWNVSPWVLSINKKACQVWYLTQLYTSTNFYANIRYFTKIWQAKIPHFL